MEGNMHVWTKVHGSWVISVWTKVLDQQTDTIHRAMPLITDKLFGLKYQMFGSLFWKLKRPEEQKDSSLCSNMKIKTVSSKGSQLVEEKFKRHSQSFCVQTLISFQNKTQLTLEL